MYKLLEESDSMNLMKANKKRLRRSLNAVSSKFLRYAILIEANNNIEQLKKRLERLAYVKNGENFELMVICENKYRIEIGKSLNRSFRTIPLIVLPDQKTEIIGHRLFCNIKTKFVYFLPLTDEISLPAFQDWKEQKNKITPCIPNLKLPTTSAIESSVSANAWISTVEEAKRFFKSARSINDLYLTSVINSKYEVSKISAIRRCLPHKKTVSSVLTKKSKILGVVTHYACEQWLEQCLISLASQDRALDQIVVLDDCSKKPPLDIVKNFANITLLTSTRNVGPYCNIQSIIDLTNFDGYLFQDADDFSSCNRLKLLLEMAEASGAEIIGSQELRIICDKNIINPVLFPLDVNGALTKHFENPALFDPLLFGTCLMSRNVIKHVGGFASGLRFGADTEFLLRAKYCAKIRNISEFCYFCRLRPGSLTTSPKTGFGTPKRQEIARKINDQAKKNHSLFLSGGSDKVDLRPLEKNKHPPQLKHIFGPELW